MTDDEAIRRQLHPLTLLRGVDQLRVGVLTLLEKWEWVSSKSDRSDPRPGIASHWIPAASWADNWADWSKEPFKVPASEYRILERPWQIPLINGWAIGEDIELLARKRTSQPLPSQVRVTGSHRIFLEEGAILEHCILNVSEGPIYVGRGAQVQEGALLRGPVAICEGAVVKMGAQLYGGTTIGKQAIVGGEVKNSVLGDYSNKGHHGYLGDAVIGQWCNLGAGSSCSNVKNNAGTVKAWDMDGGGFLKAGSKCGLVMGDHSRAAINTSFNTGTVTGICANIFEGSGLTPKFIPSFSWGGHGEDRADIEREIRSVTAWMRMKGHEPEPEQLDQIRRTYSTTNP